MNTLCVPVSTLNRGDGTHANSFHAACSILSTPHPPVPLNLKRDVNCIGTERQKFTFKDSQQTTWKTKLVRGIHCIDVAVQLVSERESGLGGKIGLWTQTAAAVPFAAPGGSG